MRKNLNIDEKKLKNFIYLIYTKEILGINIVEKIDNYPILKKEIEVLENLAYKREFDLFSKDITDDTELINQIKKVDKTAKEISDYTRSLFYFNNENDEVFL